MKKKILLSLCTFAMVLGLTACGSNEEVTYGGHTEAEFRSMAEGYMTSLESIGDGDIESYISYYESNGDTISSSLLTDWSECVSMKGEFLGYESYKLEKSGKTLTSTLVADYSNRDLKLTFVYNVNKINEGPTAINVEPVYTLGETMQKAALNTIMGILIVFCMLVVMSLVIKCFELIPAIEKKFKGKGKSEEVVKTEAPVAAPAVAETDDLALIAVISAAIAASTGASTDSFVVRSIKRRY